MILTKGYTFTSGVVGDCSPANLHSLVESATASDINAADCRAGFITNALISATAAISFGKVSLTTGKIAFGVSGAGGELTVGSQFKTTGSTLALADGTEGQVYICNASGVPTFSSISGDVTITAAGVVTMAVSGVTAGSYGSATLIPVLTFDAKGRCTSASTAALTGTITKNTSSNGAIPSEGHAVTLGHSLGAKPFRYGVVLVCIADDALVACLAGDEVPIEAAVDGGLVPAFRPRIPNGNTTSVSVKRSANANVYIAHETTGVLTAIDTTKWELKLYSWL
jgi:hypothetical protein